MVLVIASTEGISLKGEEGGKTLQQIQEQFAEENESEKDKLIREGNLPLVHVIKESVINNPKSKVTSTTFPVLGGEKDKKWPHTVFAVRCYLHKGKRYVSALSRLGVTNQEINSKEEIKASPVSQFPFPAKEQTKTIRGDIAVQQTGTIDSQVEIYVATYHDRAEDGTWNRKGEQYVSGFLFKALLKNLTGTPLTKQLTETHGVICGTRNFKDTDKRLFIGNVKEGKRTFTEVINGKKIAEESAVMTEIGYERCLAVNFRGIYFGHTDNHAFLDLYIRNERAAYGSEHGDYPYLGRTPSFATLDERVLSVSLPLPATSLVFVEQYNEADYIVLGLQNSSGRVLVFEIDQKLKEQGTIGKILKKDGKSRTLTEYLTLRADVRISDTYPQKKVESKKSSEDTSVRNLKDVQIQEEHHIYCSVGKGVYAIAFDKLLSSKSGAVIPITILDHDIISMDVVIP